MALLRDKLLERLRERTLPAWTGTYQPSLLDSLPRRAFRPEGLDDALPFRGEDVLTAYELGWLNSRGRPEGAVVEIRVPCGSANMIETGSLARYLASFAQTEFLSRQDVQKTLELDLGVATRSPVLVGLLGDDQLQARGLGRLPGENLDTIDADCRHYERQPALLAVDTQARQKETLHSSLLRCIDPITGEPDVGALVLRYVGQPIVHKGLLRYVVSLRTEPLLAEELAERVFLDATERCAPDQLTVEVRFLRRNGVQTSSVRSTQQDQLDPLRLPRE
jgi:7-cyano-7-deazaguanine reductase